MVTVLNTKIMLSVSIVFADIQWKVLEIIQTTKMTPDKQITEILENVHSTVDFIE